MSALKRNIILSNKNIKTNEMAILTIEKLSSGILGTLKIFNINSESLLLAISCNDEESFKSKVELNNNVFTFNLQHGFDIGGKISCVVVENSNNQIIPIVWDSVMANKNLQEKVNTYFESAQQGAPLNQHQNTNKLSENILSTQKPIVDLDEMFEIKQDESFANIENENVGQKQSYSNGEGKFEHLFEPESDKELDNVINQSLNQHKKFSSNSVFGKETEELKNKINESSVFYDLVSDQIEDIFSKYPSEESLESLIPNSKWVLVDYENEGRPYVLGLIYEETVLKYICYGVPGEFAQNPPKYIEQYSQWLPKNPNNISLGGYWVMYQDAVSGDNILIEYI